MKVVLRSAPRTVGAACWVLVVALLVASTAQAQSMALGSDGLGGGRYVGSARTGGPWLRAVGTLGYAHTENVLSQGDHHERTFGEVSGAWTSLSWLQLALSLDARYDIHQSKLGSDSGLAGTTGITTRHAFVVDPKLSLALQTHVQFPSANSVKRGFQAASPSFSALASYALWGTGELTGLLGYRFDRSAHAVADEKSLSAADQLGASTSRYDAALLGALLSAPIGRFTGVGEVSWDINVGSGSPSAFQSPLRIRAAVQTLVGKYLIPSFEFGVNAGGRPNPTSAARIEPRFWAAFGVGVVLDRAAPPPPEPTPTPPPAPSVQQEPQTGEVRVRVMDADRNPLSDVTVVFEANGQKQELLTDVTGRVQFNVPRDAKLSFSVQAEGWRPAARQVILRKSEGELSFALERALPEGEIKGNVRSLRGGPLKARVEVLDTGMAIETEEDGTFHIDVPPGDYRLRITAEGHEPQERTAQVERLGVTILVVDLRRTAK